MYGKGTVGEVGYLQRLEKLSYGDCIRLLCYQSILILKFLIWFSRSCNTCPLLC